MATDRMRALEDGIKQFIKPEMIAQSFSYDSSTRTFRRPCRECTQIVNFQAGIRTMAGKFTVNLGVFHPQFREVAAAEVQPDPPREFDCLARVWIGSIGTAMLRCSGQRMRSSSHMQRLSPNPSTQRTGASRFAQFRFDIQWRLAPAADAAR